MVDDPATWGSRGPASPDPDPGRSAWGRGGWDVHRFATLDSTNRWVLDAARGGAPAGLVAVADHQDAGRGRRGRTWADEPGASLLVSVLVRPRLPVEDVHVVTMAAGVAIAEAVEASSGVVARLKWPNDLVVDDRKLAGLLTEVDLGAGGEVPTVVVGVGCNIGQTAFPAELEGIATSVAFEANRAADAPRSPGPPVVVPTRDALLDAFLDRLGHHLGALDAIPARYRARLATLGRVVRVDLGASVLEGVARDVDDAGRLLVDTADGLVAVAVGDVVHVRPAARATGDDVAPEEI